MYYILNHFRNVSKLTSLVDNVSFQERGHNQISLFYEKYIKEYSPLKSIINEKVIGSIEERDLLYDELQCIFNLDLYDISSVDEFYILTSSAEIEEFSYDLSNCFLQRQLGNIKNLKYGKLKKGTNQELADIFNVSQSYISNLTSMSLFDKCNPEITILAKIACYFEISLTELIFQTNENNIEYRYFHDDIEVKNKYGDYFKDSNYFNIINSFFSHADFSNLYFSYLNYIILTFYYLGILKKNYYSSYDEDLVFPITTDMFENIDEYISLEQDQHSKRSRFSGLSYFDCSENIYNYYLNAVINIFVRIIYDIEIQLKEN